MPPVHYNYSCFPPEDHLDWPGLVPFLGPAAAAVARFDGMLAAVPNADVLLAPLTIDEAVLSSRIEGTQASVSDVLRIEAGAHASTRGLRDDAQEIGNYLLAMKKAENMLARLPLSSRVVCAAHKVLLSGVRGQGKAPGTYRRLPNWIGSPGCTIDEATYVPIDAQELPHAVSRWERYVHQDTPDTLVQTAVLHAEFEALHPFLDGNGRLGRMLVPLFLWKRKLIQRPVFYISAYLEANREVYYDRLLAVSRDGDWTGWCKFFLAAVRSQAERNLAKTRGILNLYETTKPRVSKVTRSPYAIHALDAIFQKPIFRAADFFGIAVIPQPTAHRILQRMRQGGILHEIEPARGSRSAILAFWDLIEVVGHDTD
ncbi:MAG: Fic family protein [Bryobacterales bacterium]|nr:Fic family protein [Bryobacterales bacterium]